MEAPEASSDDDDDDEAFLRRVSLTRIENDSDLVSRSVDVIRDLDLDTTNLLQVVRMVRSVLRLAF